MGLTHATLRVSNLADEKRHSETVKCLVDSGALYAVIPEPLLRRLNIAPSSTRRFVLADGSEITRGFANAMLEYEGVRVASPVIVGEPGDYALLGALTLEAFGLMLDPLKRELRPMEFRM
jgi:predicted aspartyl protease